MPPHVNLDALLSQAEAIHARLVSQRDQARATLEAIIRSARSEGREYLTPTETGQADQARAERARLRPEIEANERHLAQLRRMADEEADYHMRSQQTIPTPAATRAGRESHYGQAARIGAEPHVYDVGNDPQGRGFLLDVARNYLHADPTATERLARHMKEVRVDRPGFLERAAGDSTTGNFAGLTVPQYLTDMYAPATAALAPLADQANNHDLPPQGMALDISRITTPSQAQIQVNELDAVGAQSMDDTLLTVPVLTAAGQQKISRQAIDRGTGIEDVAVQDLFNRIATNLDSTMLYQASNGLSNAAQVITYTSASPTVAEFWPYIFQSHSKLAAALLNMAPVNAVVMSERRWQWLCAGLSSSWPIVGAAGGAVPPQQMGVQLTNEYGPAVRGRLSNGDLVCVDANIATNLGAGTNQDEVFVVALQELHVWTDPNAPVMIRAEQPAAPNLGVLLVAYEYFAFTCQRYASNPAKISGTGLVGPAGF